MNYFKKGFTLLATMAFLVSCNNELTTVPENGEYQTTNKTTLNARLSSMNITEGDLYALYPWSGNNIHKYYYNTISNDILYNNNYDGYTGMYRNYGFDYNYADGNVYLLASDDGWEEEEEGYRNLYILNIDTGEKTFIEQIISVEGDTRPQDLTFDANGTLYFAFKNGEINAYNVTTQEMSEFSYISPWNGAVGITYDFDNNQLIYAKNYEPITLYSIAIPSGEVNQLFSFNTNDTYEFGNGIEYVGNNKLLVAGRNYYKIGVLELDTEEYSFLIYSNNYLKDLLFFVNPDYDDDGVLNEEDPFPNSNRSETIYIGYTEFNIENAFVKPGTTMMDQVDALIEEINELYDGENYYYLHKKFVSELSKITYYWYKDRHITSRERSAIGRAAWSANVPNQEQR
jgi:hypothetical protein